MADTTTTQVPTTTTTVADTTTTQVPTTTTTVAIIIIKLIGKIFNLTTCSPELFAFAVVLSIVVPVPGAIVVVVIGTCVVVVSFMVLFLGPGLISMSPHSNKMVNLSCSYRIIKKNGHQLDRHKYITQYTQYV
jgi:hypothetical protein